MTRPLNYLFRMLGFLACVVVVVVLLSGTLSAAFAANPLLNSLIVLVALLGVAWNVRQVTRLSPEVAWLDMFRRSRPARPARQGPRRQ
jgi:hypothetical protein